MKFLIQAAFVLVVSIAYGVMLAGIAASIW